MNKFRMDFASCVKIGDYIWFSPTNCNGIYRYNLGQKIAEKMSDYIFFNEDIYHQKMCRYRHFLIFMPFNANKIYLFNIEDCSICHIELPCSQEHHGICEIYGECIVYADNLYVIGKAYPGILKINLMSFEIEVAYSISEKLKDFKSLSFGDQITVNENLLYVPCLCQGGVLVYDMQKGTAEQVKIGRGAGKYCKIVGDQQDFYLLDYDTHNLVHWNRECDLCKEIVIEFRRNYVDAALCISSNYIWLISIIPGEIFRIDRMDDAVKRIDLHKEFSISYVAAFEENGLIFLDSYTCNWYQVNKEGRLIDLQFTIDEVREREEIWRTLEEPWLAEHINYPIDYLLDQLCEKDNTTDSTVSFERKSLGELIWLALK